MKKAVSKDTVPVSGAKPLPTQQQQFVDGVLGGLTPAQAARAAGYGKGQGRSYTPAKAASVLMAKPRIKDALRRTTMAKAVEDGQISKEWFRDQLIAVAVHGAKQSQMESLSMLGRYFFPDKPAAAPPDPTKPVSDAELHSKIAELEAQLKPEPVHESTEKQAIVARTISEVLADQQPSTDAPERQQNAITSAVTSDAKPQPPVVNNMMPDPNERQQECGRHGEYLSTRHGSRGAWSFCPECIAEWKRNERYLASLAPAGDYRKIGW